MRLVFLPLPSGKPWNGATIYNEPLGGSEAAVAYMARAFARLGHNVTVYSHGEGGLFDNVHYVQYDGTVPRFSPLTDVVIVSRWLEILSMLPPGDFTRILWLHDTPQARAANIQAHAVFCISRFQAQSWGLDPQHTYIASDGVDCELFYPPLEDTVRDSNRLVWISNPDRGLPLAARMFQDLRKRWPDLELHVFGRAAVYGWGPDAERPYIPHEKYMTNVFLHDPLPRVRLADELRNAFAMWYPTYWPEVFCMAALESQACGTPVLCPPIGSLPEVVRGGVVGWDFLNAFSQLRNPNKWKKLSQAGLDFSREYDWASVANGWADIFKEMRP